MSNQSPDLGFTDDDGVRYDAAAGVFQLRCPVCRDWSNATTLVSAPLEGTPEIGSTVVQLHADLTVHVHNHECLATKRLVDDLMSQGMFPAMIAEVGESE